ncbi:MAG: hypothetical protein JWM64_947 [Frankiales bacterium]|nr:hypothetical protein [Frankiales bacterium]
MTTTAPLTAEEITQRNLRVVEAHFHNENPADIDKAIDLYGDTIVWEVPARGVLIRSKEAVKAAYLKMFQSYGIHSMTPIRRFASGNFVVDDVVADMTLLGDVEENVPGCPLPSGTRVSLRVVHIFELDEDGRIIRENGYELWRPAGSPVDDDIPADAEVVHFG